MSSFIRESRRTTILEGVSRGLGLSEIAVQLRVNRWVIMNDLKMMRKSGDPELEQAERARKLIKEEQRSPSSAPARNERFLRMTGKTFQEKSFQNMIDFYRPELMKILGSGDHYSAIMDLPKSVRRTLIQNGIITNRRRKREITSRALERLMVA